MIDPELALRLERIKVMTKRKITSAFAGDYISAFKGRGMEFEEVRPYQPGDEVKFIDWNVTARSAEPYVKVFREERELSMMILLDLLPGAFLPWVKARISRRRNFVPCWPGQPFPGRTWWDLWPLPTGWRR